MSIAEDAFYFEDPLRTMSAADVLELNQFEKSDNEVLNFKVSSSNFWIKVSIQNQSAFENLLLNVAQLRLDVLEFYHVDGSRILQKEIPTDITSFKERNYEETSFVFDLDIPKGQSQTYLIKLHGNEQLTIPLFIGDKKSMFYAFSTKNFYAGMFIGVIIVMSL